MDKLFFIFLRALVLGTVYAIYFSVLIWEFFSGRLKYPLICFGLYVLILFVPSNGFFHDWFVHLMFGISCFFNGYLFLKNKKNDIEKYYDNRH